MVDDYKTHIPALRADVAAMSLRRMISGGTSIITDDARLVKINGTVLFRLDYLVFGSDLPPIKNQDLDGVFSSPSQLESRVYDLANGPTSYSEFRSVKKQIASKDVYVLFTRPVIR